MSRNRTPEKAKISPDPRFGDVVVSKFMNNVMRHGKKSKAESIVYGAFSLVERRSKKDPLEVFHIALGNVMPRVEVRSRRVGGATYPIPVEVSRWRAQALAMRWMLNAARARKEGSMMRGLSSELIDAFEERGAAIKKREDVHRMAEANRAFSHYRW